jgi:hypothetical protein
MLGHGKVTPATSSGDESHNATRFDRLAPNVQVMLTLHASLVDRLPFFKNRHPQVLEAMISRLKLEFYAQGEYVIWQDDHSTEMYFIVEGLVEVRVHMPFVTQKDSGA